MKHIIFKLLILAIARGSTSKKATINMKARINYLNANLPQDYHCCIENETLRISEQNSTCVDEHNTTMSNAIENCESYYYIDAAGSRDVEFVVEDDIVYMRIQDMYEKEVYSYNTCFGNETKNGVSKLKLIECKSFDYEYDEDVEESDMKGLGDVNNQKIEIAAELSLVSAPFTVLVILVYSTISELKDLQGLIILCMSSLFLISSVIIAMEDLQIEKMQRICHSGGDIVYFALMASVFWMNALCAQTFVSLRFPKLAIPQQRQFLWYSCYAWSLPSLLVFLAIANEVNPGSLVMKTMLTFPCYEYVDRIEWKYYLGPLTAAVVVSCSLLLASTVLLFMHPPGPQRKSLRYGYMLNLKLFAVVGISWLNEPFQKLHGKNDLLWVIGDCWNLLQGVVLFLVLVLLRKRAMRAILDKVHTYRSVPWLRRYTERLTAEDEVATIVEENGLSDVKSYSKEENVQVESIIDVNQ